MVKNLSLSWPVLLLVLAIGIFFRLYKIDSVPFGLNHDGAWSGLYAIELSLKPWPLRVYSDRPWLGEAMPRYVMAFFIKMFGTTSLSIKLGMMAFTIVALPVFYFFVAHLYKDPRLALFSTLLLSMSGWDILYGKSGWRTSSVPLFVIAASFSALTAVRTDKTIYFFLTGLFLALGLNTYNAAHFLPIFVAGLFVWHYGRIIKKHKFSGKDTKNLLVFLISFAFFIFPLARYALTHPENYTGRAKYLFVGSRIQQQGSLKPLWENIRDAAFMYSITGRVGADFYLRETLLDFPTKWLLLLGIYVALIGRKKTSHQFTLWLFATSWLPSVLGTPEGSHAISTLPAVYIFSGLGVLQIYRYVTQTNSKKRKTVWGTLFIAVLAITSVWSTNSIYFSKNRKERWGFYPETTVVARYIKPLLETHDVYLTDNYPRDILTFLTYNGGSPWIKRYTWFSQGIDFYQVVPRGSKGLIFIMFPINQNRGLKGGLKNLYPQSEFIELRYVDDTINRPAAWVIKYDGSQNL